MQGLPDNKIALTTRELLPHVFTLIPTVTSGQLFSVALSVPDPRFREDQGPALHRCIALCCPDFPTRSLLSQGQVDSAVYSNCKNTKYRQEDVLRPFNIGRISQWRHTHTQDDTD
jgi:hypothetical protein